MSDNRIDLNDFANQPNHQLTLVPREDPDERASRLEIAQADAAHRRRLEYMLYVAALVLVCAAFGLCLWIVIKKDSTAEDRNRSMTLLAAIVTGFVGYVTGRATK
jgi:hypothetical protein